MMMMTTNNQLERGHIRPRKRRKQEKPQWQTSRHTGTEANETDSGTRHYGPAWRTSDTYGRPPETLLETDPAALKHYIKSKGTKSKGAQLRACPKLFELFRN